ATVDRVDDDAEADDVGQLLEGDRLALHLVPDGVGALAAPRDPRPDAFRFESIREVPLDLLDQPLVARREVGEPPADGLVGFGIEMPEREVLKLLAHLLDAHAPGEGG